MKYLRRTQKVFALVSLSASAMGIAARAMPKHESAATECIAALQAATTEGTQAVLDTAEKILRDPELKWTERLKLTSRQRQMVPGWSRLILGDPIESVPEANEYYGTTAREEKRTPFVAVNHLIQLFKVILGPQLISNERPKIFQLIALGYYRGMQRTTLENKWSTEEGGQKYSEAYRLARKNEIILTVRKALLDAYGQLQDAGEVPQELRSFFLHSDLENPDPSDDRDLTAKVQDVVDARYSDDGYSPLITPHSAMGRLAHQFLLEQRRLTIPPRLARDQRLVDQSASPADVLSWIKDYYKKFKRLPLTDLELIEKNVERTGLVASAISQFPKLLNDRALAPQVNAKLREKLEELADVPKSSSARHAKAPAAITAELRASLNPLLESPDLQVRAAGSLIAQLQVLQNGYGVLLDYGPFLTSASLILVQRKISWQYETLGPALERMIKARKLEAEMFRFTAPYGHQLPHKIVRIIGRRGNAKTRGREGLREFYEHVQDNYSSLANGAIRGVPTEWINAVQKKFGAPVRALPKELELLQEGKSDQFWKWLDAKVAEGESEPMPGPATPIPVAEPVRPTGPPLDPRFQEGSQALQAALRNTEIRTLFSELSQTPDDLLNSLAAAGRHPALGQVSPQDLVREYVGLESRAPALKHLLGRTTQTQSDAARRALIEALLSAWERELPNSVISHPLATARDALIRISRKSFVENPESLFDRLRSDQLKMGSSAVETQIRDVIAQVIEYFEETLKQQITGTRTPLFAYQREGVRFLLTHPHAILADDAGLGKTVQALGAFMSSGRKRLLWITTATNRSSVIQEAMEHTTLEARDLLSFDALTARSRGFLNALNYARIAVTNYEALVALKKSQPTVFQALTQSFDVLVADEAQFLDNPATLRSQAVREIQAASRWFLSATPYQSKLENLYSVFSFLDPERFSDSKAFALQYTQSKEGLERLHGLISQYTLRRTKESTIPEFVSPGEIPFATQLAPAGVRIPRFKMVEPEESGLYRLLPEQQDLLAWMTGDFSDFARHFNAHLARDGEKIPTEKVSGFQKMNWMQKVISEPETFGITAANPLIAQTRAIVDGRLARGEKVILWAWHHSVMDRLEKEFSGQGTVRVARLDGNLSLDDRTRAVRDFQNDPQTRILVANFGAGGVGLTLTAATTAVFVELPMNYPAFHQAMGRHHRVIGANNIAHAKEQVEVVTLVGQYTPEFVAQVPGSNLRNTLESGTLSQQTYARLQGGRLLYNLVMSGVADESELDSLFAKGIYQSLGLQSRTVTHYKPTAQFTRAENKFLSLVQSALPLWRYFDGKPDRREALVDWMDRLDSTALTSTDLLDAMGASAHHATASFPVAESISLLSNKFLREWAYRSLSRALKSPDSLSRVLGGSPTLPELLAPSRLGVPHLRALHARFEQAPQDPTRRNLKERWITALLIAADSGTLADLERGVSQIEAQSSLELIVSHTLDSAIARAVPQNPNPNELSSAFQAVFGVPGQRDEQTALLLWLGYKRSGNTRARALLEDSVRMQAKGNFAQWRLAQSAQPTYRLPPSVTARFLEVFSTPINSEVTLSRKARFSLEDVTEIIGTRSHLRGSVPLLDGDLTLEQLEAELTSVGLRLKSENDPARKLTLKREKSQLLFVASLTRLRSHASTLSREGRADALTRVRTFLERVGEDQLAAAISEVQESEREEHATGAQVVRITTSVLWGDLLSLGAPSPGLLNCFNPVGNPAFNAYVATMLASPNAFLIRATDAQGRLLGQSVVKLKVSQSDLAPVLFIEKELATEPLTAAFAQALAPLAAQLSALTGGRVWIARAPETAAERRLDQWVAGTGAATEFEYVEPVFGMRASKSVVHRAVFIGSN